MPDADDTPRDQPPRRRRRRGNRGRGAARGQPQPGTATGEPGASGVPIEKAEGTSTPSGGTGGERSSRARRRRRRRPSQAAGAGGAKAASAKKTGARKKPVAKTQGPRLPTTREVSAGGVVYRRSDDEAIEVVLASRRTRRGQLAWGLAKGGIEEGETKEQAAIREVREETGLTADIEADLGDTKYMYVWEDVRIRKTVHFFLMRHTGGDVDDRDDEMEEIRWFPLDRAMKRAAYRGERDVLQRAAELLG